MQSVSDFLGNTPFRQGILAALYIGSIIVGNTLEHNIDYNHPDNICKILLISNFSFARDDVTNAMKLFQDAKEQDLFPSHSVCLQFLNCMARSGQTEHFESGTYFVSR